MRINIADLFSGRSRKLFIFSMLIQVLPYLFFCAPATAESIDKYVSTNEKISSYLNIRRAPSLTSDIIGKLYPLDTVRLVSDGLENFYQVTLESNNEQSSGFVHKKYSTLIELPKPHLKIVFLDVGQGDSTFIMCPNGKTILVDLGTENPSNHPNVRSTLDKLQFDKTKKLDYLFFSHPDRSHFNLSHMLLDDIRVYKAFFVGSVQDYSIKQFRDWFSDDDSIEARYRLSESNQSKENVPSADIDCGEAEVFLLSAGFISTRHKLDSSSLVLMLRFNGYKVVLGGDSTTSTEKNIISRYSESFLDSDLFKVSRHGSDASISENFISLLSPKHSVISAGMNNEYGYPRKEVLEIIREYSTEHKSTLGVNVSNVTFVPSATWVNNKAHWHEYPGEGVIYSTANSGNITFVIYSKDSYMIDVSS